MEETAQRLERTARAQEPNIEIVTENNLKLMKDKLEIEETVKRLEKVFSLQELNLVVLTSGNASLNRRSALMKNILKSPIQSFAARSF